MQNTAAVGRFPAVVENSAGSRLRARRKALGLTGTGLAKLAEVSREHLSAVETGHKEPTSEWLRRVELALDNYEHETGQDEPAAEPNDAGFVRFKVEGVYGAKALIVEGPVENIAELEAAVDRIMRRLAGDNGATPE
jgi:transcriptional regulator with XRE-family HTH domain